MNTELYNRLISAGMPEGEASEISKSFSVSTDDEPVDQERLAKALEGLKESFEDSPTAEPMEKALHEANNLVEAVTRGADAILEETRAQNDAIAKALLAVGEELRTLRTRFDSSDDSVAKSLGAVQNQLNNPNAPKAVSQENVFIAQTPSEQNLGAPTSRQDLIKKCIQELRDGVTEPSRQGTLRRAVALLESGADPSDVQQTIGY